MADGAHRDDGDRDRGDRDGGDRVGQDRDGGGGTPPERPVDLRLARIHLRTGGLALARAELESLAGSGTLDAEGLLDLAEVRWRTGDLAGAGEAAEAYLATGSTEAIGLVIAAEAMAAAGRPAEARRLVGVVLERGASLDRVFAGMPRSGLWPHLGEGVEPMPIEAALELPPAPAPPSSAPSPAAGTSRRGAAGTGSAPRAGAAAAGAGSTSPPGEPGFWDVGPASPGGPPDGRAELESGREALAAGDHATAALHLGVALRLAPETAPVVLQAIGEASAPGLALVRGDALRLVGQDWEAERAFAAVAAVLRSPEEEPPGPERDAPGTTGGVEPAADRQAGNADGAEEAGHAGRGAQEGEAEGHATDVDPQPR